MFLIFGFKIVTTVRDDLSVTTSSAFWLFLVISYIILTFRDNYSAHLQIFLWPLIRPWRRADILSRTVSKKFPLLAAYKNIKQPSSHLLPSGSLKSCMHCRKFLKTNSQYRSETFNFFKFQNINYTVSFYATRGYGKEIYWDCVGKMCADSWKQTVNG